MHKIPYVKTMACGLWVNQGSKYEDDTTNGLSHLVEHLKLNKENINNPKFKMLLEDITSDGVTYNAATTKEYTYFYFAGLSNTLEKCIKALSYIADNNNFDKDFFENEKKIVDQEISSFYSSFSQIKERIGQALWGDSGIGRIIVGSEKNIDRASLEDINELVYGSYVPENSVLVVVGNIDYDRTIEIAQKYFEGWIDKETELKKDVVNNEPGIFVNNKWNGENCVISVGFRTAGFADKMRNNLEVISKILGDNSLESRLVKEIRIKRGLAYTVGGFMSSYRNRGDIGFAVICKQKLVAEVIKIMMNQFALIRSETVFDEEIHRAKNKYQTEMLLDLEDISSQLKYLGKCCSYKHVFSIENEIRSINHVKKDSLLDTAKQIFQPNNMSIAIIGKVDVDKIVPLLNFN